MPTNKFNALLSLSSRWLFPRKCISCSGIIPLHSSEDICNICMPKFEFSSFLPKGDFTLVNKVQVISIFRYNDPVANIMRAYKFSRKEYLGHPLARLMHKYYPNPTKINYIVPVPLHPRRKKERGFDQTFIISKKLSQLLRIPLLNALIRTRYTPHQYLLTEQERLSNLTNAFKIHKNISVSDKTILLVDDICTTGSTLHYCAKELFDNGASQIIAYTFSKSQFNR